jgi:hypothetical protein
MTKLKGVKTIWVVGLLAIFAVASLLPAGCGNTPSGGSGGTTKQANLNIATAGDSNMVELQKTAVIPGFKKQVAELDLNPVVFGTGTGDAGSRNIYTKLKAQKDAGKDKWDIDIAIVHESIMADLVKDDLLYKYVPTTKAAQNVTSASSKNSLGTPVEGYVIPLFRARSPSPIILN